jgi:hypothetical protein
MRDVRWIGNKKDLPWRHRHGTTLPRLLGLKQEQRMSNLGILIDDLQNRRESKRQLEAQVKLVQEGIDRAEQEVLAELDKQGLDKATGKLASVSISENIKPSVEDWDTFYAYIGKNKFWHLLERRPSVTGCRELFETKGKIPGVVPFKKRSINLRNLS